MVSTSQDIAYMPAQVLRPIPDVPEDVPKGEDPKPDADTKFVLFRYGEDPIPHGAFVKVSPENQLSPALHGPNTTKEMVSVSNTITVRDIGETLQKIEAAGGREYL